MTGFVLRRTVQGIAALLAVSLAMFLLLFVGPNPLEQLKSNPEFSPADIARLTHQYGWDKPWIEQYTDWLGNVAHGDWGDSLIQRRSARDMIMERLPLTLLLTGSALLLSGAVAIPLGVLLAARRRSKLDRRVALGSFALMAMPGFLLALGLQMFALRLNHGIGFAPFTVAGTPANWSPWELVHHLALPVISLSIVHIAGWSRYQRSEMLGVLGQEYVRVAQAKGLGERHVLMRHALPNTAMPLITIICMDVATLFGGAVGVETVYGLPGMGRLLLTSVTQRDIVVALDVVVIGAALMVLANTVADVLYGVFDPRARVT